MTAAHPPPRPWLAAYGDDIPAGPPRPRHPSLAHLAGDVCARFGARTAFTCVMPNGMNGSLSFAALDAHADAFAAYLRHDCGLEPGDRVAVQLPNCLAYPVVALGVIKAGCVLVNTNPLYTRPEMVHQFTDAGVRVLVIVDMFADKLAEVIPQTGIERVVLAQVPAFFPPVPRAIVRLVQKVWLRTLPRVPDLPVPVTRLPAALARGRAHGADVRAWWRDLTPDTLALLQYTGGTTGVAKGAMLTHGNMLANMEQVLAMAQSHLRGETCVLTALPLYHIFAFTANFLSFFQIGARNILIPSPRPVGNLQRAMENYPITFITGVNTLFNALMNEEWFTDHPPQHLVAAIAGGTALHRAVAERWEEITQAPIAEGYGLTECSPVVSFNPLSAPKLGSIGVPVPGTDVQLVDDDDHPVAPGDPGELLVKAPQTMRGYWRRDDDTRDTMRGGWLHTGDVATMDADGYLTLVDRKKDLVIVSGFNVYPNEVEAALAKLDAVLEAAVVGIPDEKSGEAVRAYVVPNPDHKGDPLTADAVTAHCRERLSSYKVPRSVVIRDALPKSPIGKILRKDLKAEVAREFGTA